MRSLTITLNIAFLPRILGLTLDSLNSIGTDQSVSYLRCLRSIGSCSSPSSKPQGINLLVGISHPIEKNTLNIYLKMIKGNLFFDIYFFKSHDLDQVVVSASCTR